MLFYISAEKSPNWRTNKIFLSLHICPGSGFVGISPYGSGSGSDFYDTNPDPEILIRIRISKVNSFQPPKSPL